MSVEYFTERSSQSLPFSAAVQAGDFVFVSGQVAKDDDGRLIKGEIEEHTRQTLRNVERVLALTHCSLADVVKAAVWLQDAEDLDRFNRGYREFFPVQQPARDTIQARLVVNSRPEVEVVALKRPVAPCKS